VKPLEDETQLARVLALDRAILFVTFDWSGQAALSAAVVLEWRRLWRITTSMEPVDVFVANPDRQSWFASWLAAASEEWDDELAGGGHGSVIWLRKGKVVAFEGFAADAGIRQLGTITDRVFLP
jgi:hypothetical protein